MIDEVILVNDIKIEPSNANTFSMDAPLFAISSTMTYISLFAR